MKKKKLKQIAKKIAELEKNHMKLNNSKIENEIEKIISESNLNLFDLMELDEMVLKILEEKI